MDVETGFVFEIVLRFDGEARSYQADITKPMLDFKPLQLK